MHIQKTMKFKIGDSVKVKEGILEPDNEEFEIGGWQGRVTDIDTKSNAENVMITIEWDSVTLQQIPDNYILEAEEDGLIWQAMVLYDTDIESTSARDSIKAVKSSQEKLEDKFYWSSFGEEGKRIEKVLEGFNPNDTDKCERRWYDYMEQNLIFPFKAIVSLESYSTNIADGDVVIVTSLNDFIDMYGIIANTSFERQKLQIPLLELEAKDKKSTNFLLINDFNTWFSNK